MLKHYKGDGSLYSYNKYKDTGTLEEREEHKNGIFFDTTNHLIYLNGETYGGGNAGDLKTTKDIRISGGPLALEFLNDSDDNSAGLDKLPESWKNGSDYKIPANTSLTEIIRLLFECEFWPTPSGTKGGISASFLLPTFSFNNKSNYKEVGSTYTITGITTGSVDLEKWDAVVQTFDHGYYIKNEETGKYELNDGTSISATMPQHEFDTKSNYIISLNFSNLGSGSVELYPASYSTDKKTYTHSFSPESITSTDSALSGSEQFVIKIGYGENTFNYSQYTDTLLKSTSPKIPSYHINSSLNNRDDEHMSPELSAEKKTCGISSYASSYSVIGVHPIYTTGTLAGVSNLPNDSTQETNATKDTYEKWWNGTTESPNIPDKYTPSKLSVSDTHYTNLKTLSADESNKFYLYLGFGNDLVVNTEGDTVEGDHKLVFLPKGWEIEEYKPNARGDYESGSCMYNPVNTAVNSGFNGKIVISQLTKADLTTNSVLKNISNQFLNWNDLKSSFVITNPTTQHSHEYTVWLITNCQSQQTFKLILNLIDRNTTNQNQ